MLNSQLITKKLNIMTHPTITINRVKPEPADIFLNGEYFGFVSNDYEFLDLRLQIKEAKATGFTVRFNGFESAITRGGNVIDWPPGLFSLIDDQLNKILGYGL